MRSNDLVRLHCSSQLSAACANGSSQTNTFSATANASRWLQSGGPNRTQVTTWCVLLQRKYHNYVDQRHARIRSVTIVVLSCSMHGLASRPWCTSNCMIWNSLTYVPIGSVIGLAEVVLHAYATRLFRSLTTKNLTNKAFGGKVTHETRRQLCTTKFPNVAM